MNCTILIVEDDKEIAELVRTYLQREGFSVHFSPDAGTALRLLQQVTVDLVVLDITLPDMSGFDFVPILRQKTDVPVIFLSARGDEPDKIIGLGLGADDYITKPFSPGELVARVKAHLRRYNALADKDLPKEEGRRVFGELTIDLNAREVRLGVEVVEVTRTEFNILAYLSQHPGRAFTFDQIYEYVWQEEPVNSNNLIMVHIKKLREKLGDHPRKPQFIQTVWGVGYKFIG